MLENPVDKEKYPNLYEGYQYSIDVVCGDIINCVYVIGACSRFLSDWEKAHDESNYYFFDYPRAEEFLRKVQNFPHVIGDWSNPENPENKILYLPWQKFMWMNIIGFRHRDNPRNPRFRVAHVEVPRGQGKALCLDTDVPTPDRGLIKFGELKVGDSLYSSNGEVCRIIGKNEIHYPEAYRITLSDGTTVDCSDNHLWVTSNKSEREREDRHKKYLPIRKDADLRYSSVRSTKEIFDTLQLSTRGVQETNHSIKVSPAVKGTRGDCQLPYVLGYWLGDGHSRLGDFTAHEDQFPEIESRFKSCRLDINIKYRKGKYICFIVPGLTFWLREMGLINNKHIPEKYFMAGEDVRRELLRGLMDSDGTVSSIGGFSFCNTNERLAKGTRRLLASLGYKSSISVRNTTDQNGFVGSVFNIIFSTPDTRPVIFGIREKEDRISTNPVFYCDKRYVVSAEKIDPKPMFCIEVDSPDKTFLITDQYVTTHNSALASQACLYFVGMDKPLLGNQVSCFATKNDQARIVLDSARAMAKKAPQYLKATGVEVQAHKIVHDDSNSFVRSMAADSKGLDGLNDILSVMDELHAMTDSLFDVVYSGMSKRRDSLMLCITTAGFNNDGVGYSQSTYAKKVCEGKVEDDQFFSIVYTIDEGDDIFAEDTWKKANPSYGHSVDPITLEAKAKKAQETPRDLPNFKVKHLNIWLGEAKAYYDTSAWDKCADPTLKFEDFYGKKCQTAADLASKIDLCSIGYVFRENGIYYVFDKTFVPEERVREVRNSLYDNSIAEGHLMTTPGNAINYEKLEEFYSDISKKVKVQNLLFDPWNAISFGQNIEKKNINTLEFRQNIANLSEPTKNLDALIRSGKIKHNGSPLLRWCLSNVVCKPDAAGNVRPLKTNDKLKIDPVVAIIMCIAQWMNETKDEVVYEVRGIRTIGGNNAQDNGKQGIGRVRFGRI